VFARYYIEKEEKELVQAEKRIEHHIEGLPGQRKPYAVESMSPVSDKDTDQE